MRIDSQRIAPKRLLEAGFKFEFESLERSFEDILNVGTFNTLKKKRQCHYYEGRQFIERPLEEVFKFFSDAHNLEKITPPWLNFKIDDQSTEKIQNGTEFKYSLKFRGIPMSWKSVIVDWRENDKFVDYQKSGPYVVWHHTHEFVPTKNGVMMYDRVKFLPPGGPLSSLISIFVRRDVKSIFNYRKNGHR